MSSSSPRSLSKEGSETASSLLRGVTAARVKQDLQDVRTLESLANYHVDFAVRTVVNLLSQLHWRYNRVSTALQTVQRKKRTSSTLRALATSKVYIQQELDALRYAQQVALKLKFDLFTPEAAERASLSLIKLKQASLVALSRKIPTLYNFRDGAAQLRYFEYLQPLTIDEFSTGVDIDPFRPTSREDLVGAIPRRKVPDYPEAQSFRFP
ncbi:hypothetical protein JCM5350_000307 [Sporobolomyces pararoseus]